MNETLNNVTTYWPFLTTILASIGLATVVYVIWCALKSLFLIFASSKTLLLMSLLTLLTVSGAAGVGFGMGGVPRMSLVGGVAGAGLGVVFILGFWLRKWVKWIHGEKE